MEGGSKGVTAATARLLASVIPEHLCNLAPWRRGRWRRGVKGRARHGGRGASRPGARSHQGPCGQSVTEKYKNQAERNRMRKTKRRETHDVKLTRIPGCVS